MASPLTSVLRQRRQPLPVAPVGPQPRTYLPPIRRRTPPDLNAVAPYVPTSAVRGPGVIPRPPRQIVPPPPMPVAAPPLPNPWQNIAVVPPDSWAPGWGVPRWGVSGWNWGQGGYPQFPGYHGIQNWNPDAYAWNVPPLQVPPDYRSHNF